MPAESTSWVGLRLEQGRYHVQRLLGEGGMGQVFLARYECMPTDS